MVTKRKYKVGACAMALAVLMTTAGGAVVNAEQRLHSPVGFEQRDEVLLELKESTQPFGQGVQHLEPINPPVTQMAPSVQKSSWFGSFWGGVQKLWNALCCSVGLTWCKVK
ncbi:TPA: SSU0592/SSU0593 family protein [Streptococcus suis]